MDMRVLEMLCSRLCHDLVSPVGAIRNGLELLEDMAGEETGFAGEAVKLIDHSAAQADRRLRLFRLAYGQAGREVKSFDDVRTAAEGWLEGGRTRLVWPSGAPGIAFASHTGLAKTLLNTVVLADEALPSGGTVTVRGDATTSRVAVSADGRNARLSVEMEAALAGRAAPDMLSARTVHAYVTGRFAEAFGLRLSVTVVGESEIEFRLDW